MVDIRLTNDSDPYDKSGFEVTKKAKEKKIPCIIITLFPTTETSVFALNSRNSSPMAIDYVGKGNDAMSILNSIQIVLGNGRAELQIGANLQIDTTNGIVSFNGNQIDLSNNQYDLLAYMADRNGAVCSQKELIKAVYNEDLSEKEAIIDRRLERLVERIQQKIEDNPSKPVHLVKIFSRGYRLIIS